MEAEATPTAAETATPPVAPPVVNPPAAAKAAPESPAPTNPADPNVATIPYAEYQKMLAKLTAFDAHQAELERKAAEAKIPWAEYEKMRASLAELAAHKADLERKAREAEERAIQRDLEAGKTADALKKLEERQAKEEAQRKAEYEQRLADIKRQSEAETTRLAREKAAAEEQANATRRRIMNRTLEQELATALGDHNLVPGGVKQLTALFRGDLQAREDGDSIVVGSLDGRSVKEFIAARLADPEFAHFVRADHRGGTAVPGSVHPPAAAPATTPVEATPQPKNFGEAIILQMQQQQKAAGDGRVNMGLGFGLKPITRAQ